MSYVVDTTKVVSETLDHETIIIHLENGTYYSLNTTASALWELIIAGRTSGAIHRAFIVQYDGDTSVIEASLKHAIDFFIGENLMREQPSFAPSASITSEPIYKTTFVPPAIERYEDMRDMLLADPIHDVESAGWPHIKPPSAP